MLRIDAQQLRILWRTRFSERMLVHLRQYFEKPCAIAGEAQVLATIDLGIARAKDYGFSLEASAQSYIDHMLMLGSHFDRDPLVPWAGEILTSGGHELQRMDRLHAKTLPFVRATAGEHARNLFFAVVRARRQELDPQLQAMPSASMPRVLEWLAQLYPEKFAAVEPHVPALVQRAEGFAQSVGMGEPRSAGRIVGLMFLLGSGIVEDPMSPWVGEILRDTTLSASERDEKLWAAVGGFADRWIEEARAAGVKPDVR